MPSKKTTETKEAKKDFLEFATKFEKDGRQIMLSGRIYPSKDSKGKIERNFMTLKVEDLLSITCEFVETSNSYFVAMPQYKSGDKYKSYVYIEKDSFLSNALEDLSEKLFELKKQF